MGSVTPCQGLLKEQGHGASVSSCEGNDTSWGSSPRKTDMSEMIADCLTKPLNGYQVKKANKKLQLVDMRRATST